MGIIEICPVCGSFGLDVEPITVKSMLKDNLNAKISDNEEWYICSGDKCEVVYFSTNSKYLKEDVMVRVWFKEQSSNVPICYCSDLTEEEIFDAVKNGCKTIDDVQKYTQKNITGKCQTENPLGKCCRNIFLKSIDDAIIK